MASVSKAYTATGTSDLILVRNKQTYTYTVTGSFVGTWIIEETRDQDNYVEIATGTGTQTAVTITVSQTNPDASVFIRSRCSAYSSGTMTVVTADAADEVADSEIIDGDGLSVFKAVDGGIEMGGTLAVTGATSVTGQVNSGTLSNAGAATITGVLTQTGQLNAGILSCSGTATITGAATHTSTTALNDDVTMADAKNIILNTSTGTQFGTASGQKLSFYGVTPVNKGTAATAASSAITHTAPGTPDAAIQDLVSTAASFGFVTKDEGNTVLRNLVNVQARQAEILTILTDVGLMN